MKEGSCVYFVVVATRRNDKPNLVVRKLIVKVKKQDQVLKREGKEEKTGHFPDLIISNINIK